MHSTRLLAAASFASRRDVLVTGASIVSAGMLPGAARAEAATQHQEGTHPMNIVTIKDGTQIFYKDWGPTTARPIVFHHGWPLSSDDRDAQMMFFLGQGFRVIAHDRGGHGRSSQTWTGNEMDTYTADVATLTEHLDLKAAIHVGHSTGGGEVACYVARAKPGRRASKALLSVPYRRLWSSRAWELEIRAHPDAGRPAARIR